MKRMLEDLRSDIGYALRWFVRFPGFTVPAMLSLALGIGANAAVFTLLDDVLLRSLPVTRPEALVVFVREEAGRAPGLHYTYRIFDTFRKRQRTLVDVIATAPLRLSVEIDGRGLPAAAGQLVSSNYYTTLGVPAAAGRTLLASDDTTSGDAAAAVLSDGYWRRQFGRDPSIVGKTVRLNGQPFTIVGVSAPEFFGTHVGEPVDITVPLSTQPQVNAEFGGSLISGEGADDFWLELMGRLRPEVPVAQAQTEINGLWQQMLPEVLEKSGSKANMIGHPRLALQPGSKGLSELRERFSRPLSAVMAVVALVLLIACANLANLLLARATSRQRELAIRRSLGASRGRIMRQLLAESILLALGGGLLGWLLAISSRQALATLLFDSPNQFVHTGIDLRVVAFTLAVSVVTGMLFGLAPAFSMSRTSAYTSLKESAQAMPSSRGRFGMTRLLVAAQAAISIVLLVGAGLFLRTLINLEHLDLGFDQDHVLALRLEPRGSNSKSNNGPQLMRLYATLLDRLRSVPSVRAASLAGSTPLANENALNPVVTVPGYSATPGEDMHIRLMQVYPDYFGAMGVKLLAGRDFSPAENDVALLAPGAPRPDRMVAVINDTMARRFFGTPEAAIGRRFQMANGRGFDVIGVARDARDRVLREQTRPLAYATYAQAPTGRGQMTLLARTSGDPRALISTVEQLARDIDPTMPLVAVQTLADRVEASTRQERLMALLVTVFATLAVVLAAIGLYGVTAYTVTRRTAEFGIRVALGSSPRGLTRLVLRESLVLVAIGLAVGCVTAAAAVRTISSLLFGLQPFDPATFVTAPLVLVAIATIAAYVPARHAARVDPLVALRSE
jgi:predicted permease